MSLLFPLYLIGAALVAVPIWLHLRSKEPQRKIPFSTFAFLKPDAVTVQQRARIDDWVLLLLRCLAVLILCLLFGVPFLSRSDEESSATPSSGVGERVVFVVDHSASMRQEGFWQETKETLRKRVADLPNDAEAALMLASDTTDWRIPFSEGAQGVNDAEDWMAELAEAPGWRATDLGLALTTAAAELQVQQRDRPALRQRVIILSDFQESARYDQLASYPWPPEIVVEPNPIGLVEGARDEKPNVMAQLLPTLDTAESPGTHRIRLTLLGASEPLEVAIERYGAPEPLDQLTLDPGISVVSEIPASTALDPQGRDLLIRGDEVAFDNNLYAAAREALPLSVRLFPASVDDERVVGSPLYYFSKAFQRTKRFAPSLRAFDEPASYRGELDLSDVPGVSVLLELPNADFSRSVRDAVEKGEVVVSFLPKSTDASALGALLGEFEIAMTEAQIDGEHRMGEIRFAHPFWRPFAEAQMTQFSQLRFRQHRSLSLPDDHSAEVIGRFENGDPAFILDRHGEGALLIVASAFGEGENQLALSTKFVPLLYSALDQAAWASGSDGNQFLSQTDLNAPGLIQVRRAVGAQTVGVNLDPQESAIAFADPRPLLNRHGVNVAQGGDEMSAGKTSAIRPVTGGPIQEGAVDLWPWVALTLIIILCTESLWRSFLGSHLTSR